MSFSRLIQSSLSIAAMLCSVTAVHAQAVIQGNAERVQTIASEHRLPPGVLMYASVPSVPELGMKFKDTSTGALINDPALGDIRSQVMEKINKYATKAEKELGFPVSDLEALAAGELAFGIMRPLGQDLGVVVLMDIGNHQDILDQLLAKVDEELAKKDALKEMESLDETPVTFYSIPNDDTSKAPLTFAYFVKDHTFCVATSMSLLETVYDRWDGTHQQTFAKSEIYQELVQKCSTGPEAAPVLKWYVNPIDLTLAALSSSPDYQMASVMAGAYLPTLGLNQLKAIGGTVEMATEKYDYISKTMVYSLPPATGLMKVFDFPSTLENPPAWIPSTSGTYFSVNWSLQSAYNAVAAMYDTFTGQPGGFDKMVNDAAKRADGPDLHPRRDVIDVVTGEFHGYMVEGGEEEGPLGLVVAWGVTDEEKAVKLVRAMASKSEVTESDFNGVTIYKNEEDSGAAAIKDGYVYLSSSVDRLKKALQGEGQPLADSDVFQRLQNGVPDKVSLLTYTAGADQWEEFYNGLRDGNYDSFAEGEIDFSQLPPFEQVAKYFQPSTLYGVQDEHGSLIVQFILRPQP